MTGGRLTAAFVVILTSMLGRIVLYGGGGSSYSYCGAHAWEQCSVERGGGTCPDGNTCCLIRRHVSNSDDDDHDRSSNSNSSRTMTTTPTSGCIPSDLGTLHGTCCSHEDDDGLLSSGCGVGYQCGPRKTCHATATVTDPLVQTLPRYRLCRTLPLAMQAMYGLDLVGIIQRGRHDVDDQNNNTNKSDLKTRKPQQQRRLLAYYSSHGPLEKLQNLNSNNTRMIQSVLIVIHGAGRNADDYFCTAMSASSGNQSNDDDYYARQNSKRERRDKDVLVIAPRFAATSDGAIDLQGGGEALRWGDIVENDWRYGASASSSSSSKTTATTTNSTALAIEDDDEDDDIQTSSFYAIDLILSLLQQQKQKGGVLADLKHIVVAGHSSGGQFVQRWALLSPYYTQSNNKSNNDDCEKDSIKSSNDASNIPMIRAVVANPSSYAYLTPLRKVKTTPATQSFLSSSSSVHQEWQILSNISDCPRYNSWEWGLGPTNSNGNSENVKEDATPAYVRHVLQQVNTSFLISRFAYRNVVYLAGERDVCNVPGNDHSGWCFSHGLETTCMDQLQGWNRLERHMTYYEHLTKLVGITSHQRAIVPNAGHDHSLMFQSPVGLYYLFHFDKDDNGDKSKETTKTE
jgi:pimeloyl-ACP methyl ester carboxylesterase